MNREILIKNEDYYVFVQESPVLPIKDDFLGMEIHCMEGFGRLIVSRELFKKLKNEFGIPNTLPFREVEGDEI